MAEVTANFLSGLALALELDATRKTIGFSDGSGTRDGKIIKEMDVLWLTDQERIVRTHSRGLNYIAYNQSIICVFFASEVPKGAVLAANAYLDVNNLQYRIDAAILENEIYQLDLQTFRTSA